uniref:G-protein coupled receptors family 1 profile domain-containing protein n=1 Tax=Monopterus albus TaxID=43700 RepID=A0A3Q3JXQ5_MONAL
MVGTLNMLNSEEAELCFPQLLNMSCKKNTRNSTPPTNLLLLSLAVADFLVGLLVMPFEIFLVEPCWFLGDLVCVLLVLISVDHYVAICDPLRYPTKITQKRVQIIVLLCWIYDVFYSVMLSYDNLKHPGRYNSCYGECVININGAVDIVVFVVAVSQARAMRSHIAAVTLQCSVTVTAKKSEMKAARTLGVLVAVFLMCYCPYYCVILYGYDIMMGSSSMAFVFLLVYFNSCLNPVIYPFFYPWFRKSVKLIVTLEILQPNSCEANVL